MIEKGKFAILYGPKDVRIENTVFKQPDPNQALIKIKACGVCPTDVRTYTGLRKVEYPRYLGHEWAGEIVDIGSEFHGFSVGDRVVADWRVVCGKCYYCRKGIFNYCQETRNELVSGGFREYGLSIASNLRIIPENISYEEAVFTEPLACCINGNRNTHISLGDDVVIIGSGPIGMLHIQLAKNKGARVIVTDPIDERLEIAKSLGADNTLNPQKENVVKCILDMTEGRGANAVIVAVSNSEAAKLGIDIAGISATVNFFAGIYPPSSIEFDPNIVHYKQLIITGSHDFTPHDFTMALKLMEYGIVNVKPIISHVIPLDDISSAFDIVANRKGLKVVVKMD
ncbi:MAG: alcohol dehydrogenase catalytic domain-containing protein [bacterium]